MLRTKLLNFAIYNGPRALMCTSVKSDSADLKKLEHYRNLNALNNADVKPSGWDEAKPFESMPGPNKFWPIVATPFLMMFPKYGSIDLLKSQKQLHEQYGNIVYARGFIGRPPVVILFDVKDIETLFRNEGVWPIRRGMEALQYYRLSRKDIFKNPGLLTQHGEDWFKLRSMVNPILMQPRNVLQYIDSMNLVADELIDNIKYFSELNDHGEMPEDFNNELYKWSLESIGVVTMDKHLGCLKRDAPKDSEPQKLIQAVLESLMLMYKLDVLPSLWKLIPTRDWKRFTEVLNFLYETNYKYINQYFRRLESGEIDISDEGTNVLHKLLKVDRNAAIAMGIDMMVAGVDTTGRVLATALYFLAKNPEVQQELRNEACTLLKDKDTPVTKETLSKAVFTKAVVKETTRIASIVIGNIRTTVKDLVLGGYQVPKGTEVMASNLYLCQREENFPRANEFLPQRWLPNAGELSHKNTNPFVLAPFGFGPRSCIGKRLANLELEVALLKIVRNFEMTWPHEDMVFVTTLLYGIARPLKIHVKAINH